MKKKTLCAILCIMLVFSFGIAAFAMEQDVIQPRWSQLHYVDTNLKVNGITLTAISKALVKSTDTTISIDMDLQMYDGGWTTIKTWSGEKKAKLELSKKYAVEKGYKYRVKAVTKVYVNGKFIESSTKTSNTVSV